MFGLLEDIPQMVVQIINSAMIGQSVTFIQIASPLTAIIMIIVRPFNVSERILNYKNPEDKDAKKLKENKYIDRLIIANFVAIVCMTMYLTTLFREDNRSSWAKKFD